MSAKKITGAEGTRVFYHATTKRAAECILTNGFRDGTWGQGGIPLAGVFVSAVPLDENEGVKGNTLLRIEVDAASGGEIDQYEIIEEGKPYREWCAPADLLNRHGRVTIIDRYDERPRGNG